MSGRRAKILFLSAANAARGQIAEGLARERFGDSVQVISAGLGPSDVHPLAIETLRKVGVDIAKQRSEHVEDVDTTDIDLVITLSEAPDWHTEIEAQRAAGRGARRAHWRIADPTVEQAGDAASPFGADNMRAHRFRVARLQIEAKLDMVAAALEMAPGVVLRPATSEDRGAAQVLLTSAQLPLDGLEQCFPEQAVVALLDGNVIGVAGMERWQSFGLLRSVVVAEEHRGQHLADALVIERICDARLHALSSIYLLTTSADGLFARLGFTAIERSQLPTALDPSSQLAISECADATAMKLQLTDTGKADALLEQHIAEELAREATLVPPWDKYPSIPRRSIGWRMGHGEWYLWMWNHWWQGLESSEQGAYRDRWQATAPPTWEDWLPQDA